MTESPEHICQDTPRLRQAWALFHSKSALRAKTLTNSLLARVFAAEYCALDKICDGKIKTFRMREWAEDRQYTMSPKSPKFQEIKARKLKSMQEKKFPLIHILAKCNDPRREDMIIAVLLADLYSTPMEQKDFKNTFGDETAQMVENLNMVRQSKKPRREILKQCAPTTCIAILAEDIYALEGFLQTDSVMDIPPNDLARFAKNNEGAFGIAPELDTRFMNCINTIGDRLEARYRMKIQNGSVEVINAGSVNGMRQTAKPHRFC